MLTRTDLMYDLPRDLIAQYPPRERGTCRLMVLDRSSGDISETSFSSIPDLVRPEDVMVLNDTRVLSARLRGSREGTGGKVEVLLLEKLGEHLWKCMIRPGKRCARATRFCFSEGLTATVTEELGNGRAILVFSSPGSTGDILGRVGSIPLPPYINREAEPEDSTRYQTVFASKDGAVAAPTAGLHFTDRLIRELLEKGVGIQYITLHVGPGTFQPLRKENLAENTMEEEKFEISGSVMRELQTRRKAGGRIIAVGTTVTRALESVDPGMSEDLSGSTDLFITPPWNFRNVDALVTNFHLPGSSLISLVGSFAGLDFLMRAYRTAIRKKYMFYSYGDAMLIT